MTNIFTGTIEADIAAGNVAQNRWDSRAKPAGSLGQIETLGVKLAQISTQCPPPVPNRAAVAVFAADHGVAKSGASKWPQEITAAMAATVAQGGAAINTFAISIDAPVSVIDVGIAANSTIAGVENAKVAAGTGDISIEPAMSISEAETAFRIGYEHAKDLIDAGHDCLIGGELGIANTTASAAIIAAVTHRSAQDVTGFGAGIPEGGLEHKTALIEKALERYRILESIADTTYNDGGADSGSGSGAGLWLVSQLGGFEIAALAGFYSCAARYRIPFIIDGVISLAALAVADSQINGVASVAIAGHRSSEPAASIALDHFKLDPLIDLNLRLGEGTGATLAFNLVRAAALALADMAEIPQI